MKISSVFVVVTLVLLYFGCVLGGTAEEWKTRTVYQIMTDRFNNGQTTPCADVNTYCGGTFKGIQDKLSYITGMGFDAIWISPITVNTDNGYHGFWPKDFYAINPNFGTEQDFINLITACHQNNVWVMIDVVVNNVGEVINDNVSVINPFNKIQYYHDCSQCPPGCNINFTLNNDTQLELCRVSNLPDLNQTVPFVSSSLINLIQNYTTKYQIDGIRIGSGRQVSRDFLRSINDATNVFTIGDIGTTDISKLSTYKDDLDSIFDGGLANIIKGSICSKKDFADLQNFYSTLNQDNFTDQGVLGNYMENHDDWRILAWMSDVTVYKNALTFLMTAKGIPFIYYGSEQGFNGGDNHREPLWTSNFNTSSDLYQYLKTLITFRKSYNIQLLEQRQSYSNSNFYAFTRGNASLVCITNVGSGGPQININITYHTFQDNQLLCNVFDKNDCVTVNHSTIPITLQNGMPKIYSVLLTPTPTPTPSNNTTPTPTSTTTSTNTSTTPTPTITITTPTPTHTSTPGDATLVRASTFFFFVAIWCCIAMFISQF